MKNIVLFAGFLAASITSADGADLVITNSTTWDGITVTASSPSDDLVVNSASSPILTLTNSATGSGFYNAIVGTTQSGAILVAGGSTLSIGSGLPIDDAILGKSAGSTGTMTVSGAGSMFYTRRDFTVGDSGVGNLFISNGGLVDTDGGAQLGENPGAVGSALVTGAGSMWSISASLFLSSFGNSSLSIFNGGNVRNVNGYVGNAGTVTVTVSGAGSTWTNTGYIETDGNASIRIENGGLVSGTYFNGVRDEEATASVVVTGAGSTLMLTAEMTVADEGVATLLVENQGLVRSAQGYLGNIAGSSGTVTINGTGSTWTGSGTFEVGTSGAGRLTVQNGGLVRASDLTIASNAGSSGTVTISGTGSTLTVANEFRVGDTGTATLSINHGGSLRTELTAIARTVTGQGIVVIAGANSTWTNQTNFTIGGTTSGDGGAGEVTVSDDGQLRVGGILRTRTNGTLRIDGGNVTAVSFNQSTGTLSFTDGSLTIDGGTYTRSPGALVVEGGTNVGDLPHLLFVNTATSSTRATVVGVDQDAALSILSGSTLTANSGGGGQVVAPIAGVTISNGQSFLGLSAGSTGAVTVSGTGSTWTMSNELYVGYRGVGSLTISTGGTVRNTLGSIATLTNASGAVTVSAATWSNSSDLHVGAYGTGTLNILAGGTARNSSSRVGHEAGSLGTVTVSGTGSTWTNSGDLYVGNLGTGRLNILAGGVVQSVSVRLGSQGGSIGTVTVSGTGSALRNTNTFAVGFNSTGTLHILNGGTVSTTTGIVARGGPAVAIANVLGSGSAWTNTGNFYVAGIEDSTGGNGTLSISGGGVVANSNGFVAGFISTASGIVTMTGSGSLWTNSGSLYLGGNATSSGGNGQLFVRGGAQVFVGDTLKTWTNSYILLENGGITARSFDARLGSFTHSSGTLTILGGTYTQNSGIFRVGSSATNSSSTFVFTNGATAVGVTAVQVGSANTGILLISGGSTLSSSGNVSLGTTLGTQGTVTISGTGSRWSVATGTFSMGSNGKLALVNGGQLTVNSAIRMLGGTITFDGGSLIAKSFDRGSASLTFLSGQFTVNGTYSQTAGAFKIDSVSDTVSSTFALSTQATTSGITTLTVGDLHHANVSVSGGATLTNGGIAALAAKAGSSANVTIHGSSSSWRNTGAVYIGGTATTAGGHGVVTITNGATLSVGGLINIWDDGSLVIGDATVRATSVNVRGTLIQNGTLSGAVHVESGGTLQGSGNMGSVSIADGGTLAPGNSPGLLTVHDLQMNGGNYVWELASLTTSGPGLHFDFVLVDGGNADLSNTALVELDFGLLAPDLRPDAMSLDPFWLMSHQWEILHVEAGGIVNGTLGGLVDSYGGLFSLAYDVDGLFLNYAAVPEPSSLLLGSLGTFAFAGNAWRRRRRNRPALAETAHSAVDKD